MKTWLSDKNRTGLIRQSQKQGLISSRLPGVLLLTRKYAFLYMSLPALCSAGILLLGRVPTQLLCSVPSSLGCQVQRILPGVAWPCANPSSLLSLPSFPPITCYCRSRVRGIFPSLGVPELSGGSDPALGNPEPTVGDRIADHRLPVFLKAAFSSTMEKTR